ncbi:MAG: hypothetical protein AAGJ46_01480 [Planctomycetota bacterium]
MLLFVALIATLNLCVGYVLGVHVGVLPSLPTRRPAEPPEPAFDLSADDEDDFAAEPLEETPPPKRSARPAPSSDQIMQSMAAFQAQLAHVGSEMQASADDDQAFGKCADRLQKANNEYLEQAHHALEEFEVTGEPVEGCREVLADSVKKVGDASDEINNLLADGVPDRAGREKLIEKAGSLEKVVDESEQRMENLDEGSGAAAPAQPAESSKEELDDDDEDHDEASSDDAPAEQSADASDELQQLHARIDAELASNSADLVIATVRLDTGGLADSADQQKLIAAIRSIAADGMEEGQQVANREDGSLLFVMTGDTVESATTRIDRLRQQVEKTTFEAGDEQVSTTVTCALGEAVEGVSRGELLQQLDEALGESEQHGANRCYHHDGFYPCPLIPEEMNLSKQTVSLGV